MNKTQTFAQQYVKQNVPQLRAGDTIRVHERIKDKDRERIQIFEGLVIAQKHGLKSPSATFTVRKISAHNVGVEKTFPLHSPVIQKIEIVKHDKVRRAKIYYIRTLRGKKKKRKPSKMLGLVYEEMIEEPETIEDKAEESAGQTPEETAGTTETKEQTPVSGEQASEENKEFQK